MISIHNNFDQINNLINWSRSKKSTIVRSECIDSVRDGNENQQVVWMHPMKVYYKHYDNEHRRMMVWLTWGHNWIWAHTIWLHRSVDEIIKKCSQKHNSNWCLFIKGYQKRHNLVTTMWPKGQLSPTPNLCFGLHGHRIINMLNQQKYCFDDV